MCRPEIQAIFGRLAIFFQQGRSGDAEGMRGIKCEGILLTKTPTAFHNKA